MEKVLITGGAGFIGSRLALKLLEHNYEVVIYDNLNPQIHGLDYNQSFNYNLIKDKVQFIKGDINEKELLIKCIKDVDYIFHMVSETGTGQSMYNIHNYVNTNVSGTALLLDLLLNKANSVKKVILTSSRSIYGEGKYLCKQHGVFFPESRNETNLAQGNYDLLCPVCNIRLDLLPTDEISPSKPTSIYGFTKFSQEELIKFALKSSKINYTILRFQNVYGPGQSLINPYTGILSIFSNLILNRRNLDVFEDGFESRDFVYIDDVIESLLLTLLTTNNKNCIFNVGSGINTSLITIANKLKELFNSDIKIIISGKYRIGDIRHNLADLDNISKNLGFIPKISLDNGLKSYVNWVKTQNISTSNYDISIKELINKGLLK